MIVDRFGDEWHKSITDVFVRQWIAALFGEGET